MERRYVRRFFPGLYARSGERDAEHDTVRSQYEVFFASAGHAALIDYPHARGLQKIATDAWIEGGVVSAV